MTGRRITTAGSHAMVSMMLTLGCLLPATASPAMDDRAAMCEPIDDSLASAGSSWPSLFEHYTSFASCDDGYIAEVYSDAVVTLLAHKWDQMPVLATLSASHPDFTRWAIKHIDATAAVKDLATIARNAGQCTNGAPAQLCRDIRQAALSAIREIAAGEAPGHLPTAR